MPRALDLRPRRGHHGTSDSVGLLVDTTREGRLAVEVTRLGEPVRSCSHVVDAGRTEISLGAFAQGSYAVSARLGDTVATTAFDVLVDPNARPRYGFVTDFRPGRSDAAAVADSLRAFHVTHVQFYDWMYRHAQLLPPTDEFTDTLGRELSLPVVRGFIAATHEAGARALAYAAVYAGGREYAEEHPDQVVTHPDGSPWMLGEFLWNTDLRPGSAWSAHLVEQMGQAVEQVGFDGLHLDQYGDPKLATARDGGLVDYADAFPAFIDAVRVRLPHATLIFNNVNDFPTRATVRAAQDVTYIEVWPPHETHADLVELVGRARDLAPHRPVILAAYLEPFAAGSGPAEQAAAKLALATTWAAGGQYLLFGEDGGVLVHPYYPNYAILEDTVRSVLRRFCDFAVANGDLLFDPAVMEGTTHLVGGINQDVEVTGCSTTTRPTPGAVWVRASTSGRRLVLQLVDFRRQGDGRWNAPREETGSCAGLTVRARVASVEVRALFGDPMDGPALRPVAGTVEGDTVVVGVPEFDTWGVLVIDR